MPDNKYDVIVIGSGPGGITCGALLAKWGIKTLVVEKNALVGGKCMTVTNKDGFTYEYWPIGPCPSTHTVFEKVMKELNITDVELLARKPMVTMHYENAKGQIKKMTSPSPDGHMDPSELFAMLDIQDEAMPEIARLFQVMGDMSQHDLNLLDDVSVERFFQDFNIPLGLYSMLASLQSEGTLEVPASLASASEFIKVYQATSKYEGGGYVKGGLGKLYGAYAREFQKAGGTLLLRAKAERILVEKGKVKGVITSKGTFYAPIVVSDAGIQPTILKLAGEENFDKSYVNYIRDLVPALGFCGARYFMKKPVLDVAMYVYFSDKTITTLPEHVKAQDAGKLPENIYVFMSTNSLDGDMAPPGKQLIHTGITCPADPKAKNIKAYMDKVESEIKRLWPKVFPNIERAEYYGPAEVSKLSRDSVVPGTGGECIGLGQVVGQCGLKKPSPTTPVSGLYITGADAGSSGMGSHMAAESGYNVFELVRNYWFNHRATF